jgi:hypothetical protein
MRPESVTNGVRITARVSASGPLTRPSELTFTLSRAVHPHGPRQRESSETPDSLYAMRLRAASTAVPTLGRWSRVDGTGWTRGLDGCSSES